MYYVALVKCPHCGANQNTIVGKGSFFPTNILNCEMCSNLFEQRAQLYNIPYRSVFNKSNNHLAS